MKSGSISDTLTCFTFRSLFTSKIAVDVGPICDFMDWIVGCIVLSFRLLQQGSFHHVMLPRTWLLRLSRIFNEVVHKIGTGVTESFLTLAQTVLKNLESQGEDSHMHLPEKNLDYRGMYISRV